jgi:hypothetical protein
MALFEMSPLGETPKQEIERLKSKDGGFKAGKAVPIDAVIPPKVTAEAGASASPSDLIDKVKASQAKRLSDATDKVNALTTGQGELSKQLDVFDKLTNTKFKDVKDLTGVDLTTVITDNKFHYGNGKYPNPTSYGKTINDIVVRNPVDISSWALKKPELGKKDNNCWTLDDILGESCDELEHYDARQDKLPFANYSDSAFNAFKFPTGINRARVPLTEIADVSNLSLCTTLDLFNISWPDFDLPNIPNPFGSLDLGGLMDDIGGFLKGMAGDGDLINLSAFSGVLNGIKCAGALIADVLVPDAVEEALKNFSIPGLGVDDVIEDGYKGLINNAMYMLNDDWMWADKSRGIYNYDSLSRVSPMVIRIMGEDSNKIEVANIAKALRDHRTYV